MSEKLRYTDIDTPEWLQEARNGKYSYKPSFKHKIEMFLYKFSFENVRIFFRDIICGVKNLFYYSPVIWNDRYWDYEYLLVLLEYKLQQMRKGLIENGIIEEKQLQKTVQQIDKIIQNLHDYPNAFEIYEDSHQEDLQKIKGMTNKTIKDELCKDFIEKSIKFEDKIWRNIWDDLKKYGRGFWD